MTVRGDCTRESPREVADVAGSSEVEEEEYNSGERGLVLPLVCE